MSGRRIHRTIHGAARLRAMAEGERLDQPREGLPRTPYQTGVTKGTARAPLRALAHGASEGTPEERR